MTTRADRERRRRSLSQNDAKFSKTPLQKVLIKLLQKVCGVEGQSPRSLVLVLPDKSKFGSVWDLREVLRCFVEFVKRYIYLMEEKVRFAY